MNHRSRRLSSQRGRVSFARGPGARLLAQAESLGLQRLDPGQDPPQRDADHAAWIIKYYIERFRRATNRGAFAGVQKKLGEKISAIEK